MGNSSKKEKLTEKTISSNEPPARVNAKEDDNIETNNNPTGFWSPAFNEYCFSDSPDDVNNKLPVPFSTVEWITLAIAYEYKLDEVRYFFVRLDAFDELTKFFPPHIYSHQDKDLCHRIYSKLVADGFNVWVDLENMYGSTIDRMAEAIENSQFILICMSQRYETSPYCKTEGQYTYKLQRPFIPLVVEKNYRPKSWLGALVGLRMYIDFTKYDFDVAYDKLRTEIQRNKSQK
ncbi:unnamed protein product [Adineta steineri]|uniref:TIR domain-containing protein n=1 Tax=Adineta steineri TaxID=433720 RepID=A0A815K8J1_9BILA|nr:unnamed protein product [Adineta steineri]CAF1610754.1 unnamed protein product [Adineta steineri]